MNLRERLLTTIYRKNGVWIAYNPDKIESWLFGVRTSCTNKETVRAELIDMIFSGGDLQAQAEGLAHALGFNYSELLQKAFEKEERAPQIAYRG